MEPELEQIVSRVLFVGVRIGGLMVFPPFFGSFAVPMRVKAGLTVVLTALLYPVYAPRSMPLGALNWLQVLSNEVMVGLLIGLTLHFVFDGVRLAGQILGFQFGFSLANLIDPQSQVDTPVLSVFHQVVALLIFLQLDVHHWMLRALAKSFEYFPPGTYVAMPTATAELLRAAGGMWLIAVQIAAPALLATFLTDVVLGFLAKASPQLPILFVGFSVKVLVGYAVLFGAVASWPGVLERHFLRAIALTERLLHLAS